MKALVAFLAIGFAASVSPARAASDDLTSKLHWRSLGPLVGGRSVAVTGVPSQPDLFYMGGVDGGVWRSTNYGISWDNISDGKITGSNSIGAIAVSLSNPKVIYVGTGEPDIRGDFITGDGIWKSTDAGNTWKFAGLRDTRTISKVVIDPKDPNIVYAASLGHVFAPNADRGVFKTTDGGKTWSKILFVDANTGAVDLVMDPKNHDVLYASMWQATRLPWKLTSGGPGSGIYKSVDGGAHWTNLTHTPGFPAGPLGKMGIGVSASNSNIVYLIAQANEGGIFRSANGGNSWTRVNSSPELRQRAFYYMAIFVDPKDPKVIYVPNVQALWISRNGGKTFTASSPPHGDNHIVWVNPNNTKILLEGDDGGAQISTDGGKTWSTFLNQPTGQYYHIGIDDAFPFNVYGAQQDDGSFEGPSNGGSGIFEWTNVADGESTFVAPEPGNTAITYGSGYVSRFVRFDKDTNENVSVAPWPEYLDGSASNEQLYRFGWTHPIQFSPANKELYTAAQVIFKSADHGKTWTKISPDLTRNDPTTEEPSGGPVNLDQTGVEIFPDISALGLSPLDANVIWSGSQDGFVHVTTDGGASWRPVAPPELPQWCEITSIEPSYNNKATAYLTAWRYQYDDYHPYIYKTTDYGVTWTKMTAGLPDDQYVLVVRIDPNNEKLMFAGTKDTVYVSYDAGAHWQSLALNLPSVQVRDIAIDTREGEVAIATHGRAFWSLDNLSLLEQLTVSREGGLRLFAPQRAWLTHAYNSDGSGDLGTSTAGESPVFGATVFFNLPKDYKGTTPVTLTFLDAKGSTIRKVTLHAKAKKKTKKPEIGGEIYHPTQDLLDAIKLATTVEPGMNRYVWDLRYESAAMIAGYNPPGAAAFADSVQGPSIVPGTYTVVLNYGGQAQQQTFEVTLDPRLKPTSDDLDARLALEMKIHESLDELNRTTNDALAARAHAKSPAARAALDKAIGAVVDFQIQSLEGELLHEAQLTDHLASLASEVDMSYTKPTDAEYQVFDKMNGQVQDAVTNLKAAIAGSN
jgi:photosystem II stability/assembly factor-like uncharacterized protein